MRDTGSRVFVFSQLRKHETITLTFHKRKYWNSGTGTGKEFRVIHRFLKRRRTNWTRYFGGFGGNE